MEGGDTILALERLAVGYDRRPILRDLNLQVERGSFTGLLGRNGSGKTTLFKTILGIIPPVAGCVKFSNLDGRMPVLGYVPQREVFDAVYLLSTFEVALMGVCGRVGPGRFVSQAERRWVQSCLEETGVAALSRKQFSELSGGQKQSVLIARALATKPDLLLLDEPTSGIDPAVKQSVMDVLRRIHAERGQTILMVSHDLAVVRQYAQRVIWLHDGAVLEGTVSELLSRDRIEALLGLEID
jgi:ABC-type Mn2+/Zn2+ transport system ATPase subunit